MIHFVVATLSEGKPIIDLFDLKEFKINKNFKIFISDKKSLTISGIGKLNSAMSVTQTFNDVNSVRNRNWVNIGLAGHKSEKIGEIFLVNKITDSSNNKVYFPFLGFEDLKSMGCTTYEKANVNYNHSLSDMESSGFFYAASKYTLKEFINIIKIVSDNEKSSINFKNKNEIYNLIIDKKEKILSLCNFVEKVSLAFEGDSLEKINFEFEKQFKNIKFTFTQTQQMKSLLKLYFSKHKTLRRNLFDQKKNGAYNLELFKKFLKL